MSIILRSGTKCTASWFLRQHHLIPSSPSCYGADLLLKLTGMAWYWRAEQYIAQSLPGLPTTPPILSSPAKVVDLLLQADRSRQKQAEPRGFYWRICLLGTTLWLTQRISDSIQGDVDEQARCAGKSHAELNYAEARTGMLTLNDEEEMLT